MRRAPCGRKTGIQLMAVLVLYGFYLSFMFSGYHWCSGTTGTHQWSLCKISVGVHDGNGKARPSALDAASHDRPCMGPCLKKKEKRLREGRSGGATVASALLQVGVTAESEHLLPGITLGLHGDVGRLDAMVHSRR